MAKPMMVIRGPVGTRSGYGDMARDIVRHLINIDKWDVRVWSCPWGSTPMNALTVDNPKDKMIIDRMVDKPHFERQPEIFISITVPNEFQKLGKFNIGITAGIETTGCSLPWIEGMNRMDLILTISEHSKRVLASTGYEVKNQQGVVEKVARLEKPIEVLHNCVDTDIFHKTKDIDSDVEDMMVGVKEKFAFLFVGHWLQGDMGQDRKDIGMLVKVFLDVFRKVPKAKRPALILKTSSAGFSVMDREEILRKLTAIKSTIDAQNFPSVYVLHGDLTEPQMNSLYNHPKVKAHVTFTKGEGFGRPLLEASLSGKPVIASGWSGHLDFLNPEDAILLNGELQNVHPSAAWKDVVDTDKQWFQVDYQNAANILHHVWQQYAQFKQHGVKLAKSNAVAFGFDVIQAKTEALMEQYLPEFEAVPDKVDLKLPDLPTLQKIDVGKSKTELPQLKKIEVIDAEASAVEGTKAAANEPQVPAGAIMGDDDNE